MDYVASGTLHSRTKVCGRSNCRCADDPSARHGPYHEWSRRTGGRLVHHVITAQQAENNVVRVTYQALAAVEIERGNHEGAVQTLLVAWERFPENTEILGMLAGAQEALGQFDAAEQIYRDLLNILPEDLGSAFNLGRLLIRKQEFGEADTLLSRVVERQPTDAEAWTNLGVARGGTGQGDGARSAFERAINLSPELYAEFAESNGHPKPGYEPVAGTSWVA